MYNNAGTVTLDSTIWTNATTRATAIVRTQDGVKTKDGDNTRRYVGTIRMNASSQCDMSATSQYVWNEYNQAEIKLYKTAGSIHDYNSNVVRYYNNTSTHFVDYVSGDNLFMSFYHNQLMHALALSRYGQGGLGFDASNAFFLNTSTFIYETYVEGICFDSQWTAAGYHYVSILEASQNTYNTSYSTYKTLVTYFG